MAIPERLAAQLVSAFLGGPWTRYDLLSRAETLFIQLQDRPWLTRLAFL